MESRDNKIKDLCTLINDIHTGKYKEYALAERMMQLNAVGSLFSLSSVEREQLAKMCRG